MQTEILRNTEKFAKEISDYKILIAEYTAKNTFK